MTEDELLRRYQRDCDAGHVSEEDVLSPSEPIVRGGGTRLEILPIVANERDGEFLEHVRWVERAIAGKRPMTLIYGREGRTELKAILTIRNAVAMLLEPDPEKRLSVVKIGCMPAMQPHLEALRKRLPPEIGSRVLLEVFEPVDKLLGLDPFRDLQKEQT